ncbi:MAG: PAS domain S-box protein [Chloroflexi bacterium]|nr:MAG: PAS domain S-box protein [Chloroflexota bacterium]
MDLTELTSQRKESQKRRILLIDDDEEDYILTRQMLSDAREGRFALEWCASFQAGEVRLAEDRTFDAVIVDYDLGCRCGIDLIRQAVAQQYPAPVLLLTGRGRYDVDVQAMEAGAADYLNKNEMNPAFLERAIRYAIERKKQELSLRHSEAHLRQSEGQLRKSEAKMRKSEAQMRKSEERYRTLFTSMLNGFALHEIICAADGQPVDYRFLEINPAFEQITGLKAADVIGKTVREVLPGIDPEWIETYGKVALTGEPAQFENYASPLGKYFQVYAFRPQPNQFAALFIDITPRKQMEAELLMSQADLANAQAVSHTGNWRLDVKRNQLLWSEETYRIFGIPPGAPLTYESFLAMIHPDDRDYVDRCWAAALAGETYDIEHRIRVGDQVKWVRERAVLEWDTQGALQGGFGTVQDITSQRRLEQECIEHHSEIEIHHRLMEFRERERQEIAQDLHDGPVQELSSIIFSLQCLRGMVQDPAIQLELDDIRSQVRSVVHDLRNKMNDLRPPALIRFGLSSAIQNHVEETLERYPTMRISLDLDQDELRIPEKTRLALFRVYQEATNNAIRHARATNIWVRFAAQDGQVHLEIRDNGAGFLIPKDWSSQTLTGHYGLPGMKERSEMIGGEFSIVSMPGEGTTVRVAAPVVAQVRGKQ